MHGLAQPVDYSDLQPVAEGSISDRLRSLSLERDSAECGDEKIDCRSTDRAAIVRMSHPK